jgi:hypothetical protein
VYPVRYEYHLRMKSKAVAVTGRGGLKVCQLFIIPHCLENGLTDGGYVLSYVLAALYPPEISCYSVPQGHSAVKRIR